MSDPVLVYRGEEIANYGFGDPHPFGTDRHDVFHAELAEANLGDAISYARPRYASVDELLLFHTADYIDKVSRMSVDGKGFLDEGDTPLGISVRAPFSRIPPPAPAPQNSTSYDFVDLFVLSFGPSSPSLRLHHMRN